ncbi:hypothetical protein VQ042_20095 [Aurantimonas sp. A2-1-M11]|uniref:hypothetical protein n=1 Tax=Aurantimonas sp. A2-1-M11 TaxID=3113712 RepID=UPI002F937339
MLHHSTLPPRLGDERVTGLAGRLKNWTVERRRQRLRRDAFNTLLHVDDHILADITGLTREQVAEMARQPLAVDALDAICRLQERASARHGASRRTG